MFVMIQTNSLDLISSDSAPISHFVFYFFALKLVSKYKASEAAYRNLQHQGIFIHPSCLEKSSVYNMALKYHIRKE